MLSFCSPDLQLLVWAPYPEDRHQSSLCSGQAECLANAEVRAEFTVCKLEFLTVRQRDLREKRKYPVPFALKLRLFQASQVRCLRHFRMLGKKFWKVPRGSGSWSRFGGSQDRVVDRTEEPGRSLPWCMWETIVPLESQGPGGLT